MPIYTHIPVMDEHIWKFDISTYAVPNNILNILGVLCCSSTPQPTACIACNSTLYALTEIHIVGIIVDYKYEKAPSGYLNTEYTSILDDSIIHRVEDYAHQLWGWKKIVHL